MIFAAYSFSPPSGSRYYVIDTYEEIVIMIGSSFSASEREDANILFCFWGKAD